VVPVPLWQRSEDPLLRSYLDRYESYVGGARLPDDLLAAPFAMTTYAEQVGPRTVAPWGALPVNFADPLAAVVRQVYTIAASNNFEYCQPMDVRKMDVPPEFRSRQAEMLGVRTFSCATLCARMPRLLHSYASLPRYAFLQRMTALESRRQLASTGRNRHFDGFTIAVSTAPALAPQGPRHSGSADASCTLAGGTSAVNTTMAPCPPVNAPPKVLPVELQVRATRTLARLSYAPRALERTRHVFS
jgi:hypothetical protein